MNRFLLIFLTLLMTAQAAQAGFNWSDTLVSPLVGYRWFSNPDHYGNSFVVGGQIRQRLTKELSLQARGGIMRSRDEGYQTRIANLKFIAVDAVAELHPLKQGQLFGFVGFEKTSIENSVHIGIGIRPKTKATFAKPSVYTQVGADVELGLTLEKDVASLWTYLKPSK